MRIFLGFLWFGTALNAWASGPPSLTPATSPPNIESLAGTIYANFQIKSVQSFDVMNATPGTTKNIDLFMGIELGSPWLKRGIPVTELTSEIPKAIQIFNACGLGFHQIHFLYLNYNSSGLRKLAEFADSSPYDPPFEYTLYQDLPQALRPMVIFNQQGYAESFNRDSVANLTAAYNVPISKIQDLSFVPSDTAFGYNTRLMTQASFSILAHEMAHVIGNLEHIQNPDANLMDVLMTGSLEAAGQAMSGDLTTGQCRSILDYP